MGTTRVAELGKIAGLLLAVTAGLLQMVFVNTHIDFDAFWTSGHRTLMGQNPYLGDVLVNANPPLLLPAFEVLALLLYSVAYRSFTVVSLFCYGFASIWLWKSYRPKERPPALWLIAIAPLYVTVQLGQIYTFLLLLVVGTWLALRTDRKLVAGVLLGILIALKPNYAVWPGLLFLRGDRRSGIQSFATAFALSLVSMLAFGSHVYVDWLSATTDVQVPWNDLNASVWAIGARVRYGLHRYRGDGIARYC